MHSILKELATSIERGKVDKQSNHPPDLAGKEGADELAAKALQAGIAPTDILEQALMAGMRNIGDKFSEGKAFIPDLLIAAKAMKTAMVHLKPYFDSGSVQTKGTFILGTVQGDMHDIGKNLVKMVLEGAGWQVIDLGTNVSAEKFLTALKEKPQSSIGLSALLTTTMLNMKSIVEMAKRQFPETPVYIGGAPVSQNFNNEIGADGYFKDPRALIVYLEKNLP